LIVSLFEHPNHALKSSLYMAQQWLQHQYADAIPGNKAFYASKDKAN
jgi:hypothetical protein